MAISLTTDGLNLDYRTTTQKEVSGTYPIGTVIAIGNLIPSTSTLTLPGTWAYASRRSNTVPGIGPHGKSGFIAIRVE